MTAFDRSPRCGCCSGSISFLRRTLPRVSVSPTGAATFAALLVAADRRGDAPPWGRRAAPAGRKSRTPRVVVAGDGGGVRVVRGAVRRGRGRHRVRPPGRLAAPVAGPADGAVRTPAGGRTAGTTSGRSPSPFTITTRRTTACRRAGRSPRPAAGGTGGRRACCRSWMRNAYTTRLSGPSRGTRPRTGRFSSRRCRRSARRTRACRPRDAARTTPSPTTPPTPAC